MLQEPWSQHVAQLLRRTTHRQPGELLRVEPDVGVGQAVRLRPVRAGQLDYQHRELRVRVVAAERFAEHPRRRKLVAARDGAAEQGAGAEVVRGFGRPLRFAEQLGWLLQHTGLQGGFRGGLSVGTAGCHGVVLRLRISHARNLSLLAPQQHAQPHECSNWDAPPPVCAAQAQSMGIRVRSSYGVTWLR